VPIKPCVFCSIISGSTPAAVVLDETTVLAFLDASPVFPGHVLVVPREHHETLTDLPHTTVTDVFLAAQRIAVGVKNAMDAEGTWVSLNNTISQSVPHVHVHVVPRRRKDGLRGFYWPRQKYASTDEMLDIAAKISAAIPPARPVLE
jgi:histidine triad (HIT) family protein